MLFKLFALFVIGFTATLHVVEPKSQYFGVGDMTDNVQSGSNLLAINVYKELRKHNQNVLWSPFSLSAALAMTWMGTDGETGNQLSKVLFHQTLDTSNHWKVANAYHKIIQNELKSHHGAQIKFGNFIYVDHGITLHPDYKQILASMFSTKVTEVDFQNEPQVAHQIINHDMSWATNGNIENQVHNYQVHNWNQNSLMVLANTNYVKGIWKHTFDNTLTNTQNFHVNSWQKVQVEMMHKNNHNAKFSDQNNLGVQALVLPVGDGNSGSILFLLPKHGKTLEEVETDLTHQSLKHLWNSLQWTQVHISIPKFKQQSQHKLVQALKNLGVQHLFDCSQADLSLMTEDHQNICVGDIMQKTVFEIDEEGTEAATATGESNPWTNESPIGPKVFNANKPFMYAFISQDGTILFMGALNNPQ